MKSRPESGSQVARNVFLGENFRPAVRRLSIEHRTFALFMSSNDNNVTLQ